MMRRFLHAITFDGIPAGTHLVALDASGSIVDEPDIGPTSVTIAEHEVTKVSIDLPAQGD